MGLTLKLLNTSFVDFSNVFISHRIRKVVPSVKILTFIKVCPRRVPRSRIKILIRLRNTVLKSYFRLILLKELLLAD
jgi:hypothetical protein